MPSSSQLELDFAAPGEPEGTASVEIVHADGAAPDVPEAFALLPSLPSVPQAPQPGPSQPVCGEAPFPLCIPVPKPTGDPLGIRMVNEFVYCPRLFYYETVEGVFVHNPDTLEGKEAHKRVDTAKPGSLEPAKADGKKKKPKSGNAGPTDDTAAEQPPSENAESQNEEPETIHARSVSLFSPLLNVTAKLDLVEGEAVEPGGPMLYTPVEYKKGRPREGDEGRELWDADRVQLMLQILLLRENGFPSEEGIVFYKETRQRVTFRPADEDESWARRMVAEAFATQRGPMPPPLEHSPKCPRCSLVSICLPDETRMLAAPDPHLHPPPHEHQLELGLAPASAVSEPKPERSVLIDYVLRMPAPGIRRVKADPDMRRLIAPNPETRTLYLNTPGTWVGKSGETVTVKEKDKLIGEYLMKDLHHVALFGPVQISTNVVQSLCDADIPLTYFSTGGWFYGMTRGHTLKNVLTRIEQFRTAGDGAASLALARMMIHGKIVNQRTLLMRNHIEPPKDVLHGLKYFAHAALMTTGLPQLLGVEGNAAGLYFGAFGGMLKPKSGGPVDSAGNQSLTDGVVAPGAEDSPDINATAPLTDHKLSAASGAGAPLFPFYPDSRNRRPPRDPVNALLSLTYALLAKECTLACYAVGLDPYVGFMHQPRHGRPALALDVMEEFRPLLADSTVITLLNNGMLTEKDFILSRQSAALSPAGRKAALTAWERRLADGVTHPLFGYKVSYRRAVELQVRLLAKSLTGEIRDYVPFMTR
jgi:CRISPR-associated protein Cas1